MPRDAARRRSRGTPEPGRLRSARSPGNQWATMASRTISSRGPLHASRAAPRQGRPPCAAGSRGPARPVDPGEAPGARDSPVGGGKTRRASRTVEATANPALRKGRSGKQGALCRSIRRPGALGAASSAGSSALRDLRRPPLAMASLRRSSPSRSAGGSIPSVGKRPRRPDGVGATDPGRGKTARGRETNGQTRSPRTIGARWASHGSKDRWAAIPTEHSSPQPRCPSGCFTSSRCAEE